MCSGLRPENITTKVDKKTGARVEIYSSSFACDALLNIGVGFNKKLAQFDSCPRL